MNDLYEHLLRKLPASSQSRSENHADYHCPLHPYGFGTTAAVVLALALLGTPIGRNALAWIY